MLPLRFCSEHAELGTTPWSTKVRAYHDSLRLKLPSKPLTNIYSKIVDLSHARHARLNLHKMKDKHSQNESITKLVLHGSMLSSSFCSLKQITSQPIWTSGTGRSNTPGSRVAKQTLRTMPLTGMWRMARVTQFASYGRAMKPRTVEARHTSKCKMRCLKW